jgi:catechol 2,3-dioxygenase-like lactoylglutathione lyase family enzyme
MLPGMQSERITAIVTVDGLAACRSFYVDLLGLQVSYDSDHYLGVRGGAPGAPELGFMNRDEMAPHVCDGRGVSLVIEVADADREHARLLAKGAAFLQPPTDQPWGYRSCMLKDPNGIVVILGHRIAVAVEYQANLR